MDRLKRKIDKYLIEYFVNPIHKVREYIENDKRGHGGPMANMLLKGKVLFDRNNIVPELQKIAQAAKEQIPEKDPMKYYACWHAFDEYLAAAYHNELQYYLCLKYLVDCYLANNGYCIIPEQKIEKFFKDAIIEYKKRIVFICIIFLINPVYIFPSKIFLQRVN